MILVTGAAGLIGHHVINTLNEQGINNIIACDHLNSNEYKWKNLLGLKFIYYLEKDNLMSYLKENKSKLQAIIHLGACSDTTEKNLHYLIQNNYQFSIELFNYAYENQIRFIYASSAATYGLGESGYQDDHNTLHKLTPLNPYGFSKHLFDLWLHDNNYLNSVVGLKYFNIFGPGERHKRHMMSLVAKAFFQIKENGTLKLFKSNHPDYKDGEQLRDFLYVIDAAKITVSFLWNHASGIINVGSGTTHSWLELAEAVFLAMKIKMHIEFIDMPELIKNQYQNFTKAEIKKLSNYYPISETTQFSNAIYDYVTQYLSRQQ